MKIEAEVDGKVLVYSSSLTMNPNGKLVFNFDNEARITVVFISEDTGDNGNRLVKSTVDDDGLGMTIFVIISKCIVQEKKDWLQSLSLSLQKIIKSIILILEQIFLILSRDGLVLIS